MQMHNSGGVILVENPSTNGPSMRIHQKIPQKHLQHMDEIPQNSLDTEDSLTFHNGYGEWKGHSITKTTRSILSDLAQYPYDDDIKNRADVIFNKMEYRVRRSTIRLQLLFYCVYCAHLELSREADPTEIGNRFGLTSGQIQKCHSLFAPLQTGYNPPVIVASPCTYVPGFFRKLGLSEEIVEDAIVNLKSILAKDRNLEQENPQTVAAGYLRYYMFINGIACDDASKISSVTQKSNVTIDTMYRKISAADNK